MTQHSLESTMALHFNDSTISTYEVRIAYALKQHLALNDETLDNIIGALRAGGLCTQSIPCSGFVTRLQRTDHWILADVSSNAAHWQNEACNVYHRWIELNSQAVER